jgi:lipoprotein-anchoring transpeptidase ErfK/SrfK
MLPQLVRIGFAAGWAVTGEFSDMILRSALCLCVLGGIALSSAQAQPYPTYYPPANTQVYPPYRGPLPSAKVPDDDDDDLPPHLRAAPGNYPPPPGGYMRPFANDPRNAPGVQREALPAPGNSGAPMYGRPGVVYGDRTQEAYPPPYQQAPAYGRGPVGSGQPESYGAPPRGGYAPNQAGIPQQYPPYGGTQQPGYQEQPGQGSMQQGPMQQGPMQLGPSGRPPGDVAGRDPTGTVRPNTVAALPPEEQPEDGKFELPAQFKRQIVNFPSNEPAGTIVIDTSNTFLLLVLGNGQAMRYGIGVGREGFTWAGAERVSKMSEWPDWHPPAEMIERQPYLPRFMAGGEGNPLGARALYLGKTLYRIHGTNQPSTIGKYVSSGCIRLTNEDIADLYSRVQVGTRVVVLPGSPPAQASNAPLPPQQPVQQR